MPDYALIEEFVSRIVGDWRVFVDAENQWENVVCHCLLEAVRAAVFADLLNFDANLKKDLVLAAVLHDGNKHKEVPAIRKEMESGGSGMPAANAAAREYWSELKTKGVPERTLACMGAVGGMPDVLIAMHGLLERKEISNDELALLRRALYRRLHLQ